jgi:hypothetical protein
MLCVNEFSKKSTSFITQLLNRTKKIAMHAVQGWIYGGTTEPTFTEPPQQQKK